MLSNNLFNFATYYNLVTEDNTVFGKIKDVYITVAEDDNKTKIIFNYVDLYGSLKEFIQEEYSNKKPFVLLNNNSVSVTISDSEDINISDFILGVINKAETANIKTNEVCILCGKQTSNIIFHENQINNFCEECLEKHKEEKEKNNNSMNPDKYISKKENQIINQKILYSGYSNEKYKYGNPYNLFNCVFGIVGAFIGALIGGIPWIMLMYAGIYKYMGWFAFIVGYGSFFGYKKFKGPKVYKYIKITVCVSSIAVIIALNFIDIIISLINYGYLVNFESIAGVIKVIGTDFYINFIISLLLGVLGFSRLSSRFSNYTNS